MANIEDLYVSDEPIEIDIRGVPFKIKELTGLDYSEIADELQLDLSNPKKMKTAEYVRELINRCVIEPEDLDVERLKAEVLNEISTAIQQELNIEVEGDNLK